MTVKNLIEKLKEFPENQLVVFGTPSDFKFEPGDVLYVEEVFIQEFDDWENNQSEKLIETCMLWSERIYSTCINCKIVDK